MKKNSFEEKMAELEKNVSLLEAGDIPLDKAIETYTETMKIAKECDNELQKAREQVVKVMTEAGLETELEE